MAEAEAESGQKKLEKAEAGHSSGHQSSYESMAETFGEIIIIMYMYYL
jgi:hypothetical protein